MKNIQSQSPTPAIGSNDATRITVAASSNPSVKNWGYVRVSTREQNDARQLIALHEFGISQDCVYTDKQSGKDFKPLLDFRIILKKKPREWTHPPERAGHQQTHHDR